MPELTTLVSAFLTLIAIFAAGAHPAAGTDLGMRHTVFMAGSVIEASAEGIYLCIGTPEGAAVCRQLDVVRLTRDKGGNPKQGAGSYYLCRRHFP